MVPEEKDEGVTRSLVRCSGGVRAVVIGTALILPCVMVGGLMWFLAFKAFSESIAEAGFVAGLGLGPAVAALVTALRFDGSGCAGALSGLVFSAGLGLLAAVQETTPEVTEVGGLIVIMIISGAVGGLVGDLVANGRHGAGPPPPPPLAHT